jgi:YlmC/YmxH family sporulation protein
MVLEEALFSIQNLKTMEVIDVSSGARIGYIKDFKIDCENYKIISILLPSSIISWFGKNNDIEIPWDRVKKVGLDIILVDGNEYLETGK